MKIRNRHLMRCAGWLVAMIVKLLARTIAYKYYVTVPGTNPRGKEPSRHFLYVVWHDAVFFPLSMKTHPVAALVSRHQDGGFLTAVMNHLNVTSVRGSTSKGGARALRELLDVARSRHIVITPDGPRGPRRKLKDGVLFLASRSGIPIVPVAFACDRTWAIRGSWTDQIIPKPFSTVHAYIGNPLEVPSNISRAQIDRFRENLQQEIDRLHEDLDQLLAGNPPPELPRVAA